PRDHLWFLNRTGGLVCDGARRTLSLRIEQPSANFMRNLQTQLLKHLQAIGKARNLENMVQSFQGGAFARSVEVKLFINPIAGGARRETDLSSMPHLRAGDELRLDVTNLSKRPMDITILFVDSQYGIEAMFPTHGHTGRLEAGGFTSANGWVNESTIGIEGMIVIAVEASKWAAPADFSFLQQPRLSSTVNVRGAAGMRPVGDIERMFREAGFGAPAATRSAGSGKRRTPFNRVAVKSVRWLVE
ncbi:MAG: hypothetical protein GY807_01910, partial [Gammaproteobacteria bacterium]|nr:hypothetical protein [Gammaproteobacteria bacterium]